MKLSEMFFRRAGSRFISIAGTPWENKRLSDELCTPEIVAGLGVTLTAAFASVAGGHDTAAMASTTFYGLLYTGIGSGIARIFSRHNCDRNMPMYGRLMYHAPVDTQGTTTPPSDNDELLYQVRKLRDYTRRIVPLIIPVWVLGNAIGIARIGYALAHQQAPDPNSIVYLNTLGVPLIRWSLEWRRCNRVLSGRYNFCDYRDVIKARAANARNLAQ